MYLIKNAKIYAPEYLGVLDVLTGGGKILRIARNLPVEDAYDVKVIDGTGKLLFPGLIDGHVHILGGGGEGGARTRTPEITLTDITKAGVTTVVGCLGTDGCTRTMSNLLAKAKGLEEEGITTYVYTGSYQVPVRTVTGSIMDEVKASTGLKMAMDAGVAPEQITFSSDGQGSLPVFATDGTLLGLGVGKVTSLYREMKDAVLKDGVSLEDALKPVTLNPAKFLKLDNKGRIAENADADLVLAAEDTLELVSVMAKGTLMIHEKEVLVKGTFE